MTITKTGGVSQNAVLADIGYGPGSLRQRPLYNRLRRRSGTMRLDDFRGNACATQNVIVYPNNAKGPNLRLDTGHHGYYPQRDKVPYVENSDTGGNQMVAPLSMRGLGGGDATTQATFNFRVQQSGNYKITGTVWREGPIFFSIFSFQVAMFSSATGFVNSDLNLDYNYRTTWSGTFNINNTVSLTTSRSYASFALYAISGNGGNWNYDSPTYYFKDFQVTKV